VEVEMQIHSERNRRTPALKVGRFVQAIIAPCTHRQCIFVGRTASVDVAIRRKAF